jgi:molybdopterin-containing oxidoreductase family iron-sulfur binding subunit
MDRRGFLKLVGAASGASIIAGCDIERQSEKLIPYLVPPEDGILPGQHTFVSTSCTECPAGCGVSARVIEDRPVKVDGLDGHPVGGGALCVRGQASINRLYLPERTRRPLVRDDDGNLAPATWDDALARVTGAMPASGRRNELLSSRTTGSLAVLMDEFCSRLGVERLPEFEMFSHAAIREANREMLGRADVPWYDIERADFLVTVGADIIGTFQNPVANAAAITSKRAHGDHFTWYHAEAHATLSGFQASHRLSIHPGSEAHLLAFLLHEFRSRRIIADRNLDSQIASVPKIEAAAATRSTGLDAAALEKLVAGFMGAQHPLLIAGEVATSGDGALDVARLAVLVQVAAGMIGSTVDFDRAPDYSRVGSLKDIDALVDRLEGDSVGVLVVSNADPVGLLPGGERIGDALDKAELVVGIGYTQTETMKRCDVVLPLSHPLESWGDVEPRRGSVGAIQPALTPLYDTRSDGDILMGIMAGAGQASASPSYQEYVMASWGRRYGGAAVGELIDKGVAEVAVPRRSATLSAGARRGWTFERAAGLDGPVAVIAPSHRWFDGRSADLPLLNEIPDPLTSISWDSWVSVSPSTAKQLGVKDKDAVELSADGWSTRLAVREQPGMADDVWAVQLGGEPVPVGWSSATGELNAYVGGISVRKTSKKLTLALLAGALGDEGRGVVPGHGVYHFAPELQHHGETHHEQEEISFYKKPEYIDYRWGMAVDMDLCVGCNACVAACYVENNVPMTGRDEHLKGREMSWIRIEPYYFDDGHADFVPAMCQHCDYAPCEPVCPVFAAYTNEQGLAVQVYNRCVGTRYCANNCPYKQRRFNWFAWNDRPEPMNLMVNPDVSVRGTGIMEKCSFCYQRIRRAGDTAKDENRKIADGEVVTACQQACPGNAIVFGNLLDETSEVSRWARSERATRLIEEIGTSPGVYYLASRDKTKHQHGNHGNSEGDHHG